MSSSGPEVSFRLVDSPVGGLLLGASPAALQVLEFTDPQKVTARVAAARGAGQPHPILDQAEQELAEYFAGRRRKFEIPLAYDGSPFQACVGGPSGDRLWGDILVHRAGAPDRG